MRNVFCAKVLLPIFSLVLNVKASNTCSAGSSLTLSEKCSGSFKTKCGNGNYPCADITFSDVTFDSSDSITATLNFAADNCPDVDYLGELKIIGLSSPDEGTIVLYSRNSKVFDITGDQSCSWSKQVTFTTTDSCISSFQIQYDWFSAGAETESSWTYNDSYDYLIGCVGNDDKQADAPLYCFSGCGGSSISSTAEISSISSLEETSITKSTQVSTTSTENSSSTSSNGSSVSSVTSVPEFPISIPTVESSSFTITSSLIVESESIIESLSSSEFVSSVPSGSSSILLSSSSLAETSVTPVIVTGFSTSLSELISTFKIPSTAITTNSAGETTTLTTYSESSVVSTVITSLPVASGGSIITELVTVSSATTIFTTIPCSTVTTTDSNGETTTLISYTGSTIVSTIISSSPIALGETVPVSISASSTSNTASDSIIVTGYTTISSVVTLITSVPCSTAVTTNSVGQTSTFISYSESSLISTITASLPVTSGTSITTEVVISSIQTVKTTIPCSTAVSTGSNGEITTWTSYTETSIVSIMVTSSQLSVGATFQAEITTDINISDSKANYPTSVEAGITSSPYSTIVTTNSNGETTTLTEFTQSTIYEHKSKTTSSSSDSYSCNGNGCTSTSSSTVSVSTYEAGAATIITSSVFGLVSWLVFIL